jgi:hypothetical protein
MLHPGHGLGLLYKTLRIDQPPCGKTRLWRVYCELKLNRPRRGKKRPPNRIREPLIVPLMRNDTRSADFMSDALGSSRRFLTFNDAYDSPGLCDTARALESHHPVTSGESTPSGGKRLTPWNSTDNADGIAYALAATRGATTARGSSSVAGKITSVAIGK